MKHTSFRGNPWRASADPGREAAELKPGMQNTDGGFSELKPGQIVGDVTAGGSSHRRIRDCPSRQPLAGDSFH